MSTRTWLLPLGAWPSRPPTAAPPCLSFPIWGRTSGSAPRGGLGGGRQALQALQGALGRQPRLGVGVPAVLQQLLQSPRGLQGTTPNPHLSQ